MNALKPVREADLAPAHDTGPPPLEELLTRSAVGDEGAFAALYDATSARAFGLVLRVVRSQALAEEVTQEVFLQVWRTSSRFDPTRGSALSWLMTLAHRRAVDRVRSSEATSRQDTAHHQNNTEIDHDSTADTALASVEAERVRAALTRLSPVQREALELAYFGGHTHVEVARITGAPVGTTKTRIRDALIHLRDHLADDAA